MPKKKRTPAQLAADKLRSEKMKAALEAKKQAEQIAETAPEMKPEVEVEDLKRQIEELKSYLFDRDRQPAQGMQVNNGRMVGTFEKYTVDPKHYPDPRERLAKEPKLQRFAFDHNYELDFNVSTVSYETKDGLNQKEPKFKLELHGIVMDEDTGEPTKGRYIVAKSTFFEDPQAAISVARENGLDVDESNEKLFLDEMRYLRMRDWLLECFYQPKITQKRQNMKEVVIGNKLVQYFEISSEDSSSIPFSELKTKV